MTTPPEFRHYSANPALTYGVFAKFALFFGLFMLMFIGVSVIAQVVDELIPDRRTSILIGSTLQAIFAFIVPSFVLGRVESRQAWDKLSLNRVPSLRNIAGVILGYMVALPAYNVVIDWNANIHLPESLSGIESAMRHAEDLATAMTDSILSDSSVWGLLSGIIVVGVITGIGEELFFRAGLQRLLGEKLPRHASIWIAAFIFSLMHFQFFGFVPRLLLGAYFGYLYVWTGSIWTAIFAHALNNSLVVVVAWLQARGFAVTDIESIGLDGDGISWIAAASLAVTVLFIYYRKIFFNGKGHIR